MTRICKKREAYAVETGDYVGQIFIVIDIGDREVKCLSVPSMNNVNVPVSSFEIARNTGIISLVEMIPRSVYKVSKAQYIKNENSNNRWK
jgi:hypothetical protein